MDQNDAVFDVADTVLNQEVVATFGMKAQNVRRELVRFMDDYQRGFFGELAEEYFGIDGGEPTDLVAGQHWKKLEPYYYARKQKEGHSRNFYARRGGLSKQIAQLDAQRAYGKGVVSLNISDYGELSDKVFLDKGGRPQWRKGTGGKGFAPRHMAYKDLSAEITLRAFPRAKGKNLSTLIAKALKGPEGQVWWYNEVGTRYAPARPILRKFLEWYATENLKFALSEKFGIKGLI